MRPDDVDGFIRDFNVFVLCGLDDGQLSISFSQWPDLGKVEKAFCVGLGLAHAPSKLGKTGPDDSYGKLALRAAEESRDQMYMEVRKFMYFG